MSRRRFQGIMQVTSVLMTLLILTSEVTSSSPPEELPEILFTIINHLNQYVKLGQQLRTEMAKAWNDLQTRTSSLRETYGYRQADMDMSIAIGEEEMMPYYLDAEEMRNALQIKETAAVTLTTHAGFNDANECHLKHVDHDHGLYWDRDGCDVIVSMAGVYLLEVTLQGDKFRYWRLKFKIFSADGDLKLEQIENTNYPVYAHEYMLRLEVGDRIVIAPYNEANSDWVLPSMVTDGVPGVANAFSVRYLGNYVQHVASTTPLPTTPPPFPAFPVPNPWLRPGR